MEDNIQEEVEEFIKKLEKLIDESNTNVETIAIAFGHVIGRLFFGMQAFYGEEKAVKFSSLIEDTIQNTYDMLKESKKERIN